MNIFTRISGPLMAAFVLLLTVELKAQSVLDPNDTIVEYNAASPPTSPVWGQIGKWVRTQRLSWSGTEGTSGYKCYVYKSNAFRLKFPKTYNPTANDGKKYPMLVFFHGMGEAGSIYDNEYSLYHGGQLFRDAVNNGTFDGYILVMQTQGGWGATQYEYVRDIINYMVPNNKLDPFRITDNGLSGGAQGTWEMLINYPTYIAGALPMSGVYSSYTSSTVVNKVKYTPIWNFHGGLDGSPAPYTAYQVRDAMNAAGGNYKNTEYPTLGHGTWTTVWAEADFWPYVKRANMANPWPLFGRSEFCPGDPINITLGLVAGLDEYQWRKDGAVIAGATSNTIQVTSIGTYDARVRRGTVWSDWSPIPVVVKIKAPTVSPDIAISGLMSKVIPAPDGNTGVTLQVPTGYTSYLWQKVGSGTTIGTTNTLNATSPGDYIVKVTEQFGCSSDFSNPFRVIDANGPNKPDAAINAVVTTLSKTSLKLDWSDNPTPQFNETNFEVYQSEQSGGPYKLVAIAGSNVLTATLNNLKAKTKYYYKVRAVNATAAAALSNEASGTTDADVTAPTAPANLVVTATTRTSISLSWTAATDDVGVSRYEVWMNGQKAYITQGTTFTVFSLTANNSYNFAIKAQDQAGNLSPLSNQVTAQALFTGLNYKYYEGNWNNLPDFGTLTPVKTGTSAFVDISVRNKDDQFAFLWEGFIIIPTTGTYTFRTSSDDGSRMWLGSLGGASSPYSFSGTPLINNDGLHGTANVDAAITLTAGTYPVAFAFFEQGGGEVMNVSWQTPGGSMVAIPASAFGDQPVNNGSAPAAPGNVVASAVSYNKINLTWTDNSNNETGFEVWRSASLSAGFVTVGTVPANTTSFVDSALNPSTTYYYRVKAIGEFGESEFDALAPGIAYKYYENNGPGWNVLPNFDALTPKTTGQTSLFRVAPVQQRGDNYGVVFESYLSVSAQNSYTFYTGSDDGSKLYIDGFDAAATVVNNDNAHGFQEKSGTRTLSPGLHKIIVTFFEAGGGDSLLVSYKIGSGAKVEMPASALTNVCANATTQALPGVPAAPTSLLASGISKSSIEVTWTDNANNETGFELFRSSNTNGNYIQIGTLPANTTSYIDTGLFANSIQYYQVRAAGAGGKSAYTNEDSAKTLNGTPVIAAISSRSARYGVTTVIPVSATDADGDALSFTADNLPAFASLADNGDQTASLTLNPSSGQQGVYNNISITVHDPNGGTDVTTFNLTINDNYDPEITTISNYSVDEKGSLTINLSATDQNAGDQLAFAVSNLPDGYTLTPGANGAATLQLNPGYAAAGTYNVGVTVTDGNGGTALRNFTLVVNNVEPQDTKVNIRFRHQTTVPAPWNNITGVSTSNLKDENNNTTSIGLQIQGGWWSTWNEGPNGNGTAMYPDAVLKEYYFFGSYPGIFTGPASVTATITGLDTSRKYDLDFLAGSSWSVLANNGTTTFTIGAQTININVQNNTTNLAQFSSIKPAADGSITFTVGKTASTQVGYLNSIVLKSIFDDGTAPAAPKTLIAQTAVGGVQLNWQEVAYNETGYEVYRSLTEAGTYNKVGETGSNTSSYVDDDINGNTHYYYKVRAINSYGSSEYSNIADATTQNRIPSIDAVANVALKNDQTTTVNVVAHDDVTDHVTLSVSGLPSFATFTDNGDGTGSININPNGVIGSFTGITISATDDANATSTENFDIAVTDKDVQSVYVNFTDGVIPGPKPWNNFTAQPYANAALTNLKDDADQATGMSVTLTTAFQWYAALGMRPGNGKGIYPESVMRTGLYEGSSNARTIRIAGLNTSKQYNIVLFNSLDNGFKGLTNFTINGTTVSLNATYNYDKTVQINGITPNASGQINITIQKAAGQDNAYLNAMIIQGYDPVTTTILSPTELRVRSITNNSVAIQWQDRSSDETGFEIWRATSSNGSYSLLTTVAANTTSYTNSNLSANSTYYYIVRAVKSGAQSAYTGAVSATTYNLNIYVNYANTLTSPLPWFNTKTNPQQDYVWSNVTDATGAKTNVNMVITKNFAGLYSAGVQTGNNSGIYPDNVMFDSYGLFPGETGIYKLTGLNMSMKYDFTFFGSTTVWGDVNTSFTINDKSVLLNTSVNSTGTLTISGVQPDENGEVEITVKPGTPASQFGLLGAMEVHGYNAPADDAMPAAPGGAQGLITSALRTNTSAVADETKQPEALGAYPNPFKQGFTLTVPATANEKVDVQIFDVTGRMVYRKLFSGLNQGTNVLTIETGSNLIKAGVYMVRVNYINSAVSKVIKLEKQ